MSADKDIFTGLLETVVNYYSREAVLGALDYIADLDEAAIKVWTQGMTPEQVERVFRVWEASRKPIGLTAVRRD